MVIDVARAMASRNLLTLRAELDEQTKGIQKLQKEVEQATQHTINQLSFSIHEKCHKNTANDSNAISRISHASSSATGTHNALSSVSLQSLKRHLHAGQTIHGDGGLTTQCSAMQNGLDGTTCLIDRNPAKTSLNDYSSFFINSHRRPEAISSTQGHQRHSLNQPINELNLTVQELIKKNAEMDIRCNESKSQDEVNRKLQDKIQELETANGVQEEMLKQAHAYIDILKEMLQKRDYVHQDLQGTILTYIKASGKEIIPTCDLSNLGTFVVKILQEQADDASALKTKLQTNEDQLSGLEKELEDKENSLKQCQERCDHFAKKYEQEMAAMSHEMNTATSHAKTMQNQFETFQQQNTELKNHIANLDSVVSEQRSEVRSCKRNYKDKMEELNKQLLLANTALEKAQNEHTLLSQDYDKQLQELNQLQEAHKVCEKQLHLERDYNWQLQEEVNVSKLTNDHLRRELLERSMKVERLQQMVKEESQQKEEEKLKTIQDMTANANVITCQLETMKATLQKMTQELAAKTQSLKNAEKNLNESKVHLAGKEEALKNAVDELRKLRMYAEAKKKELLQLKATSEQMSEMLEDTETLKLLLVEKDNMIKTLRNQIQTLTRVVEQQNQKVESLEAEKFQLLEEVFLNNAFIQETKVVAEKKDMRIHELEEICRLLNMEKSKLTNECIEKTCAANKLRKERKEIVAELRETQHELACLSEDYEILKRNNRNQTGDTENATAILKMQLKAAIAELAQTKNTMKTVENCDGHAIKIATRMQKKITAKREQIDTLQTRIQFLEEALSNSTEDTQHLKLGKTKLLQKCAIQAAEKIKLCDVAEILKSENIALKGNVLNTEATLDKTLLQLSECQAVIQRLEQEITLLRLQHTLDLKELRGPFSSEISAKPTRQVASKSFLQCCDVPVREYDLLIKSCPKVIMSTQPSGNFNMVEPTEEAINLSGGLPCAPFKDEALLKLNREADHTSSHISKEPLTLHTTDLEDKVCSLSLISSENHITVSPCYTSSLKKHYKSPKNRPRSPVYSLLTAPTSETDIFDTMDRNLFLETVDADNFVHGEQHNELTDSTCQMLQHRLEYLQTIAEDLQMKNKEMSLMIGNHENQ